MYMLLSALPVVSVIAALLAGWRSLYAALVGVAAALLAIAMAFSQPASIWVAAAIHWAPVLLEVVLIVGGGLLLSEVLRQSGAQKALADWLLDMERIRYAPTTSGAPTDLKPLRERWRALQRQNWPQKQNTKP